MYAMLNKIVKKVEKNSSAPSYPEKQASNYALWQPEARPQVAI